MPEIPTLEEEVNSIMKDMIDTGNVTRTQLEEQWSFWSKKEMEAVRYKDMSTALIKYWDKVHG